MSSSQFTRGPISTHHGADCTCSSAPSGGTLATVLSIFNYFTLKEIQEAQKPYALSPAAHKQPTRPVGSLLSGLFGSRSIPDLGIVTTSLAASTDTSLVERTWGLLSVTPSRKDEFYGPNFTWNEVFRARNWLHGAMVHWGLLLGGFLIACIPPVRTLLRKFIYQPGEGPQREDMQRESIEYRGVAKPEGEVKGNQRAFCKATYSGSMYYRKCSH